MLFRRISAHLKRQDWFAVGLDLLIVVVGIYIGLQVDAWNSTRHDSYGYTHRYDSERILKNPYAANITSWVSGWGAYHASVMAQHHEDTIVFRDILRERLEQ